MRTYARLVAMGMFLGLATAVQAEALTLRYASQHPSTHPLLLNFLEFKTAVEQRSNQSILIEVFDDSKLYDDKSSMKAVDDGAIDMATVSLTQYVSRIPSVDIFRLPFLFQDVKLIHAAQQPESQLRRSIDAAIATETKTKVLWWQLNGTGVIFSRGRTPALEPRALVGKKVRTQGEADSDVIRSCGGTGIVISASKQRDALANNEIDMAITPITGVNQRKLWEVSDTITRTNHTASMFVVIINDAVWARLTKEQQAIMVDAAKAAENSLVSQSAKIEADAFAFARSKGMLIADLSKSNLLEWRACTADMVEIYVERGGPLAHSLVQGYAKLLVEPCCDGKSNVVMTP
jgi:C4-dicarboxylate-binding protein DctP